MASKKTTRSKNSSAGSGAKNAAQPRADKRGTSTAARAERGITSDDEQFRNRDQPVEGENLSDDNLANSNNDNLESDDTKASDQDRE